jgi:hypothetical protein
MAIKGRARKSRCNSAALTSRQRFGTQNPSLYQSAGNQVRDTNLNTVEPEPDALVAFADEFGELLGETAREFDLMITALEKELTKRDERLAQLESQLITLRTEIEKRRFIGVVPRAS